MTRTKKYKEADEADIGALFPEVMKNCGDKLAEYMCDDRQKVAALAATCVGASDASKSWRLLGHAGRRLEDVAMRITQVDFPLFVEERDAYSLRLLALAAKGDAQAKSQVTRKHLDHEHCACEETQVFIPACAESPEKCLELCRNLFETLELLPRTSTARRSATCTSTCSRFWPATPFPRGINQKPSCSPTCPGSRRRSTATRSRRRSIRPMSRPSGWSSSGCPGPRRATRSRRSSL